jgi:hypothetical protein
MQGLYRPLLFEISRIRPRQASLPPGDFTGRFVQTTETPSHDRVPSCSDKDRYVQSNKGMSMNREAHLPVIGRRLSTLAMTAMLACFMASRGVLLTLARRLAAVGPVSQSAPPARR